MIRVYKPGRQENLSGMQLEEAKKEVEALEAKVAQQNSEIEAKSFDLGVSMRHILDAMI